MPSTKTRWPKPAAQFTVPIYGGGVYLFTSQAEYAQALAFLKQSPAREGVAGCARWLENQDTKDVMYMVGWFDKKPTTLVHEATHVALYIAEYVGFSPKAGGGEPFCYLLDTLLEKLGLDKPT